MYPAPRLNKLLMGTYLLISVGVLVAGIAVPRVRAIAYAPLRDLLLPPPEPVVVHLLYSTEKEAWLTQAIERFEQADIRLEGHPIEVELSQSGSREMVLGGSTGGRTQKTLTYC